MSFLQHLESINKKTGSFKVVRSYLKEWQKIVSFLAFLALFLFVLGPLFLKHIAGKQATWQVVVILVAGISLLRIVSARLLGAYKATGVLTFEDDRILLTNNEGEVLHAVSYDEIKRIRRMVGVTVTGTGNRRPSTAYIQIVVKDRPTIEFESEWNSSVKKSLGIEEVIKEIRVFKKLDA
jgi:hypothetical protein